MDCSGALPVATKRAALGCSMHPFSLLLCLNLHQCRVEFPIIDTSATRAVLRANCPVIVPDGLEEIVKLAW